MPDLYLASQSPRRQALLRQLGVDFDLLLPDADEDAEALEMRIGRESALRYVQRVTQLKADAAWQRLGRRAWPTKPILCADTTVALAGEILGKPEDAPSARRMLKSLSGTTHRVLTALVLRERQRTLYALSESRVRFTRLSTDDIDQYIASGEPFGKAGAYGIQGLASAFVQHISGSYTGIMGLPLYETRVLLKKAGVL